MYSLKLFYRFCCWALYDFLDLRTDKGFKRRRGVLSVDEPLFNFVFPVFDCFCSFLLELDEVSGKFFANLAPLEVTFGPTLEFACALRFDAVVIVGIMAVVVVITVSGITGDCWTWVLGLTCTSQGGGAILYDGNILKVTDPRASR